jgi:hypothetical protein
MEFLGTFLKLEGRRPERIVKQRTIVSNQEENVEEKITETINTGSAVKATDSRIILPRLGERVIFHLKNKSSDDKSQIAGKIVSMDNMKGTVTIESGGNDYEVFRGRGYFTAAKEIPKEETVEYALEAARKFVKEDGKIYFASKDGEYKGEILEIGAIYAVQRVGKSGNTAILHRLKDFEKTELLREGANLVVKRVKGQSSASENTRGSEPEKGSSLER